MLGERGRKSITVRPAACEDLGTVHRGVLPRERLLASARRMGASAARPAESVGSRAAARSAAYAKFVKPFVRGLVLASAAATFLHSAGTVQLVYTVRPSFVLMGLAVLLGLPIAFSGWRSAPPWIRWSGTGLIAAYLICLLFEQDAISSLPRAGSHRDLVYLGDLVVGMGAFGLVYALWSDGRRSRELIAAIALSGAIAGAYAVYQWHAQIWNWPLNDVINVADSNALTSGGSQGDGVLGYERVRGTFLEPHLLGAFLAGVLPVTFALWPAANSTQRRLLCVVAASILIGLLFTTSAPAWGILLASALTVVSVVSIAGGRPALARALAAVLATLLIAAPVAITYPSVLTGITGRSGADLALTSSFRTETWATAIDIWAHRPAIGFGPGQSSVQLTLEAGGKNPVGLLSAQGLWAAALIDSGILGFAFWMLMLGAILRLGVLSLARRPTLPQATITTAALIGVASALIAGDRLDLWVWILLGLLTAMSVPQPLPGAPPELARPSR